MDADRGAVNGELLPEVGIMSGAPVVAHSAIDGCTLIDSGAAASIIIYLEHQLAGAADVYLAAIRPESSYLHVGSSGAFSEYLDLTAIGRHDVVTLVGDLGGVLQVVKVVPYLLVHG